MERGVALGATADGVAAGGSGTMPPTDIVGPAARSPIQWRSARTHMSRDPDAARASDAPAATGHRDGRAGAGGHRASDAADPAVTELLLATGGGDETAFAQLYDAVSGRVFGLARRITRNHALAEEVMQDVMVEVWRTAPRFDARRASGIGWILMLAHRRAVDRVRRSTASRAREVRDAARHPVQDPLDEGLLADEERREVTAALEGLTELQREAITLAYYEGHTYREVATLLDVPEGTAKSRLRGGLRQLRDTLRGTT